MNEELLQKGYVQVYTGNCKGKTTAALGLAFRAMGKGLKTYVGQFMKGGEYAELESARMVSPYITIEQYGKKGFIRLTNPPPQEAVDMASAGLEKAKQAIASGKYDIIILDEINTANYFNLVPVESILELIKNKPNGIELVLTGGPKAHDQVIEAADLVTQMVEVKHYYQQGVPAREGIEK
ncbi:MAG: cob(I)yrinic acid a,c-diamide adenosyltransferase [Syntrophomonadaceae bacterium]|jgi:cob(I)alamin adenosyltransferase